MAENYDALARAIREAGFFTTRVANKGTWDRICVCSKRDPRGYLTGNSFWVTKLSTGWYLGTWAPCLYRLPNESRIAELCVAWLRRVPNGTRSDFDDQLRAEFELIPVSDDEFDTVSGTV